MSNTPLRPPETLMEHARGMARAQGVSVNQFLATVIAERVGELKALNHVRARIGRADMESAWSVLALVPDRPPMEGDELPGRWVWKRQPRLFEVGGATLADRAKPHDPAGHRAPPH